jgi:hypothetical protein
MGPNSSRIFLVSLSLTHSQNMVSNNVRQLDTFLSCLDTVGFIGKTINGKQYMLSVTKFGDFLEKLVQMIRSAQADIR